MSRLSAPKLYAPALKPITWGERRVRVCALLKLVSREGVTTKPLRPWPLGANSMLAASRARLVALSVAVEARLRPPLESSSTEAPPRFAAPMLRPPVSTPASGLSRVTSRCGPAETRTSAPWAVWPAAAPLIV